MIKEGTCTLKKCELYEEEGFYYLKPTYIIEDEKEVKEITVHKVHLPLYLHDYACTLLDHSISPYVSMLNLQNDIKLRIHPDKSGVTHTVRIIEEKVHELTMDEVEKKLGFKVKIVNKKK